MNRHISIERTHLNPSVERREFAAPVRHSAADAEPRAEPSQNRVLIVDDHADAAVAMGEALRILGYEVRTAQDGLSALGIATTFHPNVCLLDIGLPTMDGYELLRRLRDADVLPAGARMVAVTGYGGDADRRRSTEAGFNAHLVKPVSYDVLARAVVH